MSMPSSLLSRLCLLPRLTWDRLLELWYTFDRGVLLLSAMPLVLVGVVVALARFAYVEHQQAHAAELRRAELRCLAQNVYYESRGEPLVGQYAVAEVTMNRVASPRFPGSVCEVVHERRLDRLRGRYVGAFSWTELELRPPAGPAWRRAQEVAVTVLDRRHEPVVPDAVYYHAVSITPRWAKQKTLLIRIGDHVFYR
jgi:N-acetylmuramoyl-L-alanine amidase